MSLRGAQQRPYTPVIARSAATALHPRHCEERSDVAIQAVHAQAPGCNQTTVAVWTTYGLLRPFGPRNDDGVKISLPYLSPPLRGAQRRPYTPVIARSAATWQSRRCMPRLRGATKQQWPYGRRMDCFGPSDLAMTAGWVWAASFCRPRHQGWVASPGHNPGSQATISGIHSRANRVLSRVVPATWRG